MRPVQLGIFILAEYVPQFSIMHLLKNITVNFFLRIEDTDVERSTQEAVDKILEGMLWLNLNHDGDIIYQAKNFNRHKEIITNLLQHGHAYECYSSKDELEQMRQDCEKKGIKPKYDGTWRPEEGKTLATSACRE